MKKIIVVLMMVVMGLSVALVMGQTDPENNPNVPPLPAEMKLNKEQKQEIKQLTVRLKKELIPLKGQIESKMIDLKTETDAENPDMSKINVLVDETARLRAEIAKRSIANKLAIAKLLTPEQREFWKEHKGKMKRAGRHEFRQGRRGNRQPDFEPQPPLQP